MPERAEHDGRILPRGGAPPDVIHVPYCAVAYDRVVPAWNPRVRCVDASWWYNRVLHLLLYWYFPTAAERDAFVARYPGSVDPLAD